VGIREDPPQDRAPNCVWMSEEDEPLLPDRCPSRPNCPLLARPLQKQSSCRMIIVLTPRASVHNHLPMRQSDKLLPLAGVGLKKHLPITAFLLLTMFVVGNPHVIRADNTDSYGYTYIDSNTPGGPTYNWIEISGTGTQVLQQGYWPPWVDNLDLGFLFDFYGTQRSQLSIGQSGLLFFEAGTWNSWYWIAPITQTPDFHDFIAPYYSSYGSLTNSSSSAGPGSDAYYQTLGTAPDRMFVVEWQNPATDTLYSGITFEAILYEGSNNILFQYKDVAIGLSWVDNGADAAVGIEDPSGNMGLQYSYMQPVITPGLAILCSHPIAVSEADLYVSISAPAGMGQGQTMTYALSYGNLGGTAAPDVTLTATLPPTVDFVSSSAGGAYDSSTRNVTWNIGTVTAYPSGLGATTVTVAIPTATIVGTVLETGAPISTSAPESKYDNNTGTAQTVVTEPPPLPPYVGVQGAVSLWNADELMVGSRAAITYIYNDSLATGVDILIHVDEDMGCTGNCGDITGSMTQTEPGGPWSYTATLWPRHGNATVTYTVHYPSTPDSLVGFNVYVDPSGYIFNVATGERVSGASVWLQRANGLGGWANVAVGQSPAVMDPDLNPQTTGTYGQYQWDTLPGTYRVHVEASGYYPADSIVVAVPPPVTDLYVGLTPLPAANSPPAVGSITAPGNPVQIYTVVSVSANFVDPDKLDTHTAVWDWGDGSASKGTVTEANGSGSVTGTHAYASGGVYTTTLTVSDGYHDASSTVMINVLFDTSPPIITIGAKPSVLWPANGKMVTVTGSGQISDAGSGVDLSGASFSVTDDYGEIQPQGTVIVGARGTYSFALELKAKRKGNDKKGRHYTICVRASDRAGNTGSATAVVTVPHDAS
jgi:uncharacterized repeat protein (TIGR01451 family)